MWERFNYNAGTYENNRLLEYTYSDNRLASVEDDVWNYDGQKWVHDKKTVYHRDSNGNIMLTEHQQWNGITFTHYKRTLYERNESGYPTTMTFQDYSYDDNSWVDGAALIDAVYYGNEYANDKDYLNYEIPAFGHNRLVDSVFTDEHLKFVNDQFLYMSLNMSRLEFSYIETPNPHYAVEENDETHVAIYPNPTKGVVNIRFAVDAKCHNQHGKIG